MLAQPFQPAVAVPFDMGELAALTVEHGNRQRETVPPDDPVCIRHAHWFTAYFVFDESILEKILLDVKKNYTNSHHSSSGIGTFLMPKTLIRHEKC